jgi:twitching motility protein PilJ
MAEQPSGKDAMMKNPKITWLVVTLVLLVVGYIGSYYLVLQDVEKSTAYLRHSNALTILSQEMSSHGGQAAAGGMAAFPLLAETRAEFDTHLGNLINGNAAAGLPPSSAAQQSRLKRVAALWAETRGYVDTVLNNRAALLALDEGSRDLLINLSAIQQENSKVVAELLRRGVPAGVVVRAQYQAQLVERMSHTIDKLLEVDGVKNLSENFNRDRADFIQVLEALTNGDRALQIPAANTLELRTSLDKIEVLFRSVSASTNEIIARAEEVSRAKAAAQGINVGAAELLVRLSELTDGYEDEAGQGLASPLVGLGCALAAFFVMLIIGILLSRQAKRSVTETRRQNEQNQQAILQLLDELADFADGDLRVQVTVTENFTGAIADSINFSIDQMRAMVSKINATSSHVSAAANETRNSVSQLSDASLRQAKEIADVSAAVNEMAISIDQVSYNAAESSSVAERSVDIAGQGAIVVQNTIGGMDKIRGQIQETAKRIKRLGESSQEIGDIVSLINDIADQTNILSLNAAIQASMAGDAGKGFAVVADEVQRLAERSGAAAKQISALVKTIQSDTHEAVSSMEQTTAEVVQGTRLAKDAGVSLGEIEGVSKTLAEIIQNISDAARQQAASAGKISNTMKSIEDISSQTTAGTKSTATAVGNLADMANELRASVTGFKLPA